MFIEYAPLNPNTIVHYAHERYLCLPAKWLCRSYIVSSILSSTVTLYATYLHLAGSIWCHIPGHYVFFSVQVLLDGGYGWQYFRCFLCLIKHAHSASCMSTLYHSPHLLLFVLGQPCRGIWYAQPWFVPHITPVRTICPAAPGEFLLLSFTTSGGMFLVA